jgi:hypothetical protein
MDMVVLEDDILPKVFALLQDPKDLCRCAIVCTRWHSLSSADYLWRRHIEKSFSRTRTQIVEVGQNLKAVFIAAFLKEKASKYEEHQQLWKEYELGLSSFTS